MTEYAIDIVKVTKRFAETTRVTTEGAESFFAELPSGPLPPALRFAALAEPTKPAADESENPEAVVPPGYEGGSDGGS